MHILTINKMLQVQSVNLHLQLTKPFTNKTKTYLQHFKR